MRGSGWLWLLMFFGLFLILFAREEEPQDWNDCRKCHEDLYEDNFRYMHPRETDCMGCHVSHDRGTGKLLLGDEVILCQEPCHTDLGRSHPTGKNLRNPTSGEYQEITCTNRCHDPHGSNYKAILRMEARDLCFSCHDL